MKRRLCLKSRLSLIVGLLSLFIAFSAFNGYSAARRGDAPRCQEACLADHERQMKKLIKDFEAKQNRLEFQDSVENAVRNYNSCIENCKEPQPVK